MNPSHFNHRDLYILVGGFVLLAAMACVGMPYQVVPYKIPLVQFFLWTLCFMHFAIPLNATLVSLINGSVMIHCCGIGYVLYIQSLHLWAHAQEPVSHQAGLVLLLRVSVMLLVPVLSICLAYIILRGLRQIASA